MGLIGKVGIPLWEICFPPLSNRCDRTQISTSDGTVFDVLNDAIRPSAYLVRLTTKHNDKLISDDTCGADNIRLENIDTDSFELVLKYCYFHSSRKAHFMSDEERDEWDLEFFDLSPSILCAIANAAYKLEIEPLTGLACQAISKLINGKSVEQIRKTFDMTESFQKRSISPPPAALSLHNSERHETQASKALQESLTSPPTSTPPSPSRSSPPSAPIRSPPLTPPSPSSPSLSKSFHSHPKPSSPSPPILSPPPTPSPPSPSKSSHSPKPSPLCQPEIASSSSPIPPLSVDKLVELIDHDDHYSKKKKRKRRKRKRSRNRDHSSTGEPPVSIVPSSPAHDLSKNNSPSFSLASAFAEDLLRGISRKTRSQPDKFAPSTCDTLRRSSLPTLPTQDNADAVDGASDSSPRKRPRCSVDGAQQSRRHTIDVIKIDSGDEEITPSNVAVVAELDSSSEDSVVLVQADAPRRHSTKNDIAKKSGDKRRNEEAIVVTDEDTFTPTSSPTISKEEKSSELKDFVSEGTKVTLLNDTEIVCPETDAETFDQHSNVLNKEPLELKRKNSSNECSSTDKPHSDRPSRLREMKKKLEKLKKRDCALNRERNECQQEAALLKARIEGYMEGQRDTTPSTKSGKIR